MREVLTGLSLEDDNTADANDILLAKRIADTLHKHYPGHLWACNVKSDQGVVNIFAPEISMHYGYVLYLSTINADPGLKCVMRAAGEILERANINRGPIRDDIGPILAVEGIPNYIPGRS